MAPRMEREESRSSSRTSSRMYQAPEAHEKYEVWPEEIPSGMDLQWLPTRIAGAPNPQVMQYYRAGWQPAKSSDFSRISGFGVDVSPAMLDAGLLEIVKGDAPVVVDDQMLVMRPKELTLKAERQRNTAADEMVVNQMRRLQQTSRAFKGTEIKHGRFAPMPDQPRADYEE